MKKLMLTLLAAAMVGTSGLAQAQGTAAEMPHKVGLIDMGHVFQEYTKFKELRSELEGEIEKSDAQAKQMLERLQALQKSMSEKYTAGTPEFDAAEKQLRTEKADFDAFRAATQRKLAKMESDTFKAVYADVTKATAQYAQYKKYTMVLRFNRAEVNPEDSPGQALQNMNKLVIYHQSSDDITDTVLRFLNDNYAKQVGRTAAPAAGNGGAPVRTAGSTRRN